MKYASWVVLGKRIKSIKAFLMDSNVPKRKKFLIIFGIIYLILPIDIVPEPVFLAGIIDDLLLWIFILVHLKDELDKYWKNSDNDFSPQRDLKGKIIVESSAEEYDAEEYEERAHGVQSETNQEE